MLDKLKKQACARKLLVKHRTNWEPVWAGKALHNLSENAPVQLLANSGCTYKLPVGQVLQSKTSPPPLTQSDCRTVEPDGSL